MMRLWFLYEFEEQNTVFVFSKLRPAPVFIVAYLLGTDVDVLLNESNRRRRRTSQHLLSLYLTNNDLIDAAM